MLAESMFDVSTVVPLGKLLAVTFLDYLLSHTTNTERRAFEVPLRVCQMEC